jgi:hypothetical protein
MEVGKDNRPPRGALAVVAVGLFATVAAALLSTDKPIGSAELEWEAKAPLPASKHVAIPGGGGMSLSEAGLRATEATESGYRLFRVASVLTIDAGSAVGHGRLRCTTRVPGHRATVARTPKSRAAYPRSSSDEDLLKQGDVPEDVEVEFHSHGAELAAVGLGDAFDAYTPVHGVVVSWAPYREGSQGWQWGLPKGRPAQELPLGFASIWKTSGTPAAQIACTLETTAGSATVNTAGALKGLEGPS